MSFVVDQFRSGIGKILLFNFLNSSQDSVDSITPIQMIALTGRADVLQILFCMFNGRADAFVQTLSRHNGQWNGPQIPLALSSGSRKYNSNLLIFFSFLLDI